MNWDNFVAQWCEGILNENMFVTVKKREKERNRLMSTKAVRK